jgi:hypothetical protein
VKLNEIAEESKVKINQTNKQIGAKDVRVASINKEAVHVYMIWIYMWCFTLGKQQEKENIFRLN